MVMKFDKSVFVNALKRAIWTMAQTALSFITIGAAISDINWKYVASVSLVAGVYSLLKSIVVGMPESSVEGEIIINDNAADKTTWTLQVEEDIDKIPKMDSIRLKVKNL